MGVIAALFARLLRRCPGLCSLVFSSDIKG